MSLHETDIRLIDDLPTGIGRIRSLTLIPNDSTPPFRVEKTAKRPARLRFESLPFRFRTTSIVHLTRESANCRFRNRRRSGASHPV